MRRFCSSRSEHDDRQQTENVHVHGRGAAHGRAGFSDRLHHDRRLGDAETGSALLDRHRDAEPAGRRQRGMKLAREIAGAILGKPIAVVERGAELEDRVPDLLLLRAQ